MRKKINQKYILLLNEKKNIIVLIKVKQKKYKLLLTFSFF